MPTDLPYLVLQFFNKYNSAAPHNPISKFGLSPTRWFTFSFTAKDGRNWLIPSVTSSMSSSSLIFPFILLTLVGWGSMGFTPLMIFLHHLVGRDHGTFDETHGVGRHVY